MLTQPQCDQYRLKLLLHGDDSSQEFASLASHVEVCERCQLALTELAAEQAAWREIPRLLENMPESTGDDHDLQSPLLS